MGFVLIGVFARNELALQGAMIQMICHGISTGALFILVGALQERTHTREMARLGGLWDVAPRMGGVAMLFSVAALGLPGLGNFIGEFLILLGVYQVSGLAAALAAVGLISGTIYSLWMVQKTFHGERRREESITDLSWREMGIFASLIAAIVWIGLYPQPLLSMAKPALDGLKRPVAAEQAKSLGE
jgi:NADH-quinone oxidoreductase subunit M